MDGHKQASSVPTKRNAHKSVVFFLSYGVENNGEYGLLICMYVPVQGRIMICTNSA